MAERISSVAAAPERLFETGALSRRPLQRLVMRFPCPRYVVALCLHSGRFLSRRKAAVKVKLNRTAKAAAAARR
jgi:hypothetical protein